MPRATRNNNARESRNWGKISGVTVYTQNPSGTTMYKGVLSTSQVTTTTLSSSYGYTPWYGTDAKTMVMGVLDCTGTSLDRQSLGLTTIDFCVASATSKRSAVTPVIVTVDAPFAGMKPGTGVTEVCFHVWSGGINGAVSPSPVSIQYFAIGTA